jgi:putative PIG3 family NAD(P)H quinone oxidoreductase
MMQAILVESPGGPEQLRLGEWEKPVPGRSQILVKVAATALNRADTLQRKGHYPPPPGASPILGLEMAGTVAELGDGVTRWKEGEAVFGLLSGGGYAEYAIIHEDMALPIPSNLSMTDAAALPEVFLTAFQALSWLAQLKAGEKVLIHAGASGVGTAAIQLVRAMNAIPYVTASAAKHALCLSLGAELAIDYKKEPFQGKILAVTNGQGVNVILDFMAASYFGQNLTSLATDGRMVLLATMGGSKVSEFDLRLLLIKRLSLMGSTLRSRSLDYQIRLSQAWASFALPLLEEGRLKPVVDRVFDWTQAAEAHAYMESNQNQGKVVLAVGS